MKYKQRKQEWEQPFSSDGTDRSSIWDDGWLVFLLVFVSEYLLLGSVVLWIIHT